MAFILAGSIFGCTKPALDPDAGTGDTDTDGDTDGDTDSDSDSDGDFVGCSEGSGEAAHPFGSHEYPYAGSVILPDEWPQEALDNSVCNYYTIWKNRYMDQGCGDGRYYVATDFSSSLTVSEAHGYGMIISAYLAGFDPDAKIIFDGMFQYFVEHPSEGSLDLMAWSQDYDCDSNEGAHSATDGDLDIAFALLLADKQWGSGGEIDYYNEAAIIINAIMQHEVDSSTSWLLLGDWVDSSDDYHHDATRPSDFMPGHFDAFESVIGNGDWSDLQSASYSIMESIQSNHSPSTGLLPDFVVDPGGSPDPAAGTFLETEYDGEYSYNACRTPLRIGIHHITSGSNRAGDMLAPMNAWIKSASGNSAWDIDSGYWLDGDTLPGRDYSSGAFVGPFGVAAMTDSGSQSWLNDIWTVLVDSDDELYFDDTIRLLSMITMSGNWWAPEVADCP